jgi:predicted HTH transcriptional regulator
MESHFIEYKSALMPDTDLEKEVVAFLNSRTGDQIFIGIDNSGDVIGVQDTDKLMLQIKDRIKNNIEPSVLGLFDIIEEKRDGENIIKIIVASGSEKPYYKKKYGMTPKGAYIREPMTHQQIENLFANRTRHSIRRIKSPRQDLTFEQLQIYYEERGKLLNNAFKKNLELLNDENQLNYVAYLLADENNISVKVAKYKGKDKSELIEANEYGYCSLIKSVKRVLDKVDLENKTFVRITTKERIEKRIWQPLALREAIINAFVHNDYTREFAPTIEIFSDRISITSSGTLPDNLSKEEFFNGYSIPKNKELMRVFKDLNLVEQLGSGIPRILQFYGEECFDFTDNFTRISFPVDPACTQQVSPQVSPQEGLDIIFIEKVKSLIKIMNREHSRKELMNMLGLKDREYFRKEYLQTALKANLIEPTTPDKTTSSKQKYRLTQNGKELQERLRRE